MQEQERLETGAADASLEAGKQAGTEPEKPEEAGTPAEAPTNGWLEQFYSRFDGVPLRALDIFIGVCVFAFIAVITVGILKARGIL